MGCEERMNGKKRESFFFLVLYLHIRKWWGVWEGESYGGRGVDLGGGCRVQWVRRCES